MTVKEPVCWGCGGDVEDCDGLVKRDRQWWCADCWNVYTDPTINVDAAEEARRQRILDELEAQ